MSSDEKRDSPDYRDTKQIPAVKVPTNQIDELVSMVRDVRATVADIADGQVDLSARISRIEHWKESVDGRLATHSGGAKQLAMTTGKVSENDAAQDRAIAETLVKVRGLETTQAEQTAKLGDLKTSVVTVQAAGAENTFLTRQAIAGFFKTPLGMALLSLAMAAVGYATNWLTSHGGHP